MRFTPTCPVCRRQDADPHRGAWHCTGCNTVFTGSQLEWERTRDMRERWAGYEAYRQRLADQGES